ncbi:hypothetical protein DFH09DRAFT_1076017 [Mycena vulgaris]|nr:hypothetical protein DFH09DRAFT_1076017 [Mycena vulgaris]
MFNKATLLFFALLASSVLAGQARLLMKTELAHAGLTAPVPDFSDHDSDAPTSCNKDLITTNLADMLQMATDIKNTAVIRFMPSGGFEPPPSLKREQGCDQAVMHGAAWKHRGWARTTTGTQHTKGKTPGCRIAPRDVLSIIDYRISPCLNHILLPFFPFLVPLQRCSAPLAFERVRGCGCGCTSARDTPSFPSPPYCNMYGLERALRMGRGKVTL